MCAAVYQALQHALNEQLGPQNLIDVLRLLQLITYERNFVVGSWTLDLIKFLHEEMWVWGDLIWKILRLSIKEPDVEWLPYCVAILCNLLGRSKTLCKEFKQKVKKGKKRTLLSF
jgi:hypothetical protein